MAYGWFFNEILKDESLDDETPDDEIVGDEVTKFLIVEKNYFQQNIAHELYKWEKHEEVISIEKVF